MEKYTLPELPVLDDFDLYLSFLRSHDKVPVTNSNFHLKQADLFRLNAEMHFKTDWVTEKSMQPHYPLLDFFYQVTVAGKLARVHHEKKGVYLRINPEQLEKYDLMTRTERYFLLLESVWCHMNWVELTGARSLYFAAGVLELLGLMALSEPGQALEVQDRKIVVPGSKQPVFLGNRKVYEVFWFLGFYDLVPDATLAKKPDSYAFPYQRVIAKELSKHLAPVLLEQRPLEVWNQPASQEIDLFEEMGNLLDILEGEPRSQRSGVEKPDMPFIAAFKPLFETEELSEDLYSQGQELTGGRYTIKVALSKKLYRTIAIGASATLEELHLAIQEAYEFDNDHLYAFFMDGKEWSDDGIYDPRGERGPFADEARLGELDLYTGRRIVYLFDFGDCWLFEVVVQQAEPNMPEPDAAIVVEEKGEAPEQYGYEDEDW